MTESEGTQGDSSSSSASSTSSSGTAAKKPRRRAATGARRKTATAGGAKTARKKAGTGARRKGTTGGSRKAAPRRRRRTSSRPVGLQTFLNDLAKRANRAGSTIADLSEKGADAARGTIGKVSTSSRQTITRVRKEWDKLDNARKAQFVAGLLAALAATAAGVAKASRNK